MKRTTGWLAVLALVAGSSRALAEGAVDVVDIHDDPGLPTLARPAPSYAPAPAAPSLADPARGRNAAMCTADTSRRGELTFTNRALFSVELAVGVTNWLELGVRATPLLMLIPELGPKESLWMGSTRIRLVGSRLFALTADVEGLAAGGWAGLRSGMTMRIGNDRFAFHGNASELHLWKIEKSCESCNRKTHDALLLNGGVHLRVHRRVKLMLDVSYYRDREFDMLLSSPAVRIHGEHFAADFGVMVMSLAQLPALPLPLINFSVSY